MTTDHLPPASEAARVPIDVDALLLEFRRACESNAYPASTPAESIARNERVQGGWRALRELLSTQAAEIARLTEALEEAKNG